ncbi:MAG: patatin-like phospholipase family protein [Bacteroidota bacterium]
MQPIHLVLSGGGARGVAHLGVVKALQEQGVVIEAISGVSSGALFGAFLAGGLEPEEVLALLQEHNLLRLLRPAASDGILSMHKLEETLWELLPVHEFEKLNYPLIVSCSDLTQGHTDYFSKGDMIKPLLASCAIPVLFPPVEIEGDQLIDGGLINNLPVEPFLDEDVTLVGVHVNPWQEGVLADSILKVMERAIALSAFQNVRSRKRFCDVYIEPQGLVSHAVFETSRLAELFEIGYEAGMQKWPSGGAVLPHSSAR